jgi:hypothetical protein
VCTYFAIESCVLKWNQAVWIVLPAVILWNWVITYCHCPNFLLIPQDKGGPRWRSWSRHCATSRNVSGSIPDGVTGIFHWHNPFGHTMALGLTQTVTEMSSMKNSWSKGARCVGLTTLPPSYPDCLEIWGLNLLESSGPVQACNWVALPGNKGLDSHRAQDRAFTWPDKLLGDS